MDDAKHYFLTDLVAGSHKLSAEYRTEFKYGYLDSETANYELECEGGEEYFLRLKGDVKQEFFSPNRYGVVKFSEVRKSKALRWIRRNRLTLLED